MNQPVLYLMVGLPGAGKTTAALAICKVTGAIHVWADQARLDKFGPKTGPYSQAENHSLFEQLNSETAVLLGQGKSVVFDTAFNYFSDREKLRDIAQKHRAKTVVVWVQTPAEVARERATKKAHLQPTRVLPDMTHEHFDILRDKMEEPQTSEHAVVLDGTKVTAAYVKERLADDPSTD